jgi:hypothetical protein
MFNTSTHYLDIRSLFSHSLDPAGWLGYMLA